MKMKAFQELLPALFALGKTGLVWGAHGIGKSEAIEHGYAKANGYPYYNLRIGTAADIGDIIGLLYEQKDAEGNVTGVKFSPPQYLVDLIDYCNANPDSRAVLFLDEINRAARKDLLQGLFQMVLDRRLGTLEFPDNLDIIAAANPDNENYQVLNMDDGALLDRFIHIPLEPATSEWLEYGKDRNYETTLLSYIQGQPGALEDESESFDYDKYAKPSRRSVSTVNDIMALDKDVHGKEVSEATRQALIFGIWGTKHGTAYLTYHRNNKATPVEPTVILNKYTTEGQKKIQEYQTQGHTDVVSTTLDNLVKEIEGRSRKITDKQFANVALFLQDVDGDLALGTFKNMLEKCEHIRDYLLSEDNKDTEALVDHLYLKRFGKRYEDMTDDEKDIEKAMKARCKQKEEEDAKSEAV